MYHAVKQTILILVTISIWFLSCYILYQVTTYYIT